MDSSVSWGVPEKPFNIGVISEETKQSESGKNLFLSYILYLKNLLFRLMPLMIFFTIYLRWSDLLCFSSSLMLYILSFHIIGPNGLLIRKSLSFPQDSPSLISSTNSSPSLLIGNTPTSSTTATPVIPGNNSATTSPNNNNNPPKGDLRQRSLAMYKSINSLLASPKVQSISKITFNELEASALDFAYRKLQISKSSPHLLSRVVTAEDVKQIRKVVESVLASGKSFHLYI